VAVLHAENWDGVTAPAIPAGWNASSPIVTAVAGPTPLSSPNMVTLSTTSSSREAITWGTPDGVSGNVIVQGTAYFQGSSFPIGNASVLGRGSVSTLLYTSSTFYELNLSLTSGALKLNAIVAGTSTTIASSAVSVAYDTWYRLTLTLTGSAQAGLLESLSGSTWSTVTSITGADSSIAAVSGYAGWAADEATIHTAVYGDDWSLSTPSIIDGPFNKFDSFIQFLGDRTIDLDTDVLAVMLSNVQPVASNSLYGDITEIASGGGYVTGGLIVPSTVLTRSGGVATLTGDNVVPAASGGSIGPFRYWVLYDVTAAGKPLIAWWDALVSVTLLSGQCATLNLSGGILTIQ
jgi:hypothetical protein